MGPSLSINSVYTMDSEDIESLKMNEDDDDEGFITTGENSIPTFTVSVNEGYSLEKFKTIIFTTNGNVTAFGFHYLSFDGKVSIGKIQKKTKLDSSDIEIWGLRMKKPEPSHLYQITEDFYSFSSTVLNILANQVHVLVLTTVSLSDFKSDVHPNELDGPITRVLKTTSFKDSINCLPLEQPNILSGISAGILSACDIRGIPAAACIVYSSSMELDTGVVNGFSKFLSTLGGIKHLKINSSRGFPLVDKSIKTGNLYI